MRVFFSRFLLVAMGLTALLGLVGCGSAPSKGLGAGVPDWVIHTPSADGDSYVFVGSGTSESGDIGTAEKAAAADLRDQIVSYLGVQITSTSTATAKGSLDSYQAEVEQTVVSKSKAQIAGLRVADRFPVQRGKALTLYLKALYNKADLDREKARLQALFAEIDDAVSIPEKKGDALAANGDLFNAIDQYTLAAAAALDPNVDNHTIRLQRNLGKTQTLLSKMTILSLVGPQTTEVGKPFAKPFEVKVVNGSSLSDPPVPGVSLRFNYKTKVNGRLVFAGVEVKTDDQGVASFTYPTPDFAAKDNVIVMYNVGPFLDRLSQVPRSSRNRVDALEDTIGKSRLNLPFTIVSGAVKIPIALLILEFNNQGKPAGTPAAGNTLAGILSKQGFHLRTLEVANTQGLQSASDDQILSRLKRPAEHIAKRLAFGTATITQVNQDSGMFTAEADGQLKIWDLASGTLLYSQTKSRLAVGSDKSSAEANALRQLGDDLGNSVIDNLP